MICSDLQRWAQDRKAVFDAAMLTTVAFAVVLAWVLRRRPGRAALSLALAALAAGVAMSMDDFLHPWDERFHALVAHNLVSHPLIPTLYERTPIPSTIDWTSTHVFLHKPPLSLWLIAASLRLAGTCELFVRLPSVLFLALAVLATFRIGTLLFEPRVGLTAAFLIALNGELLELASGRTYTDHPDSVLISLICIGIWAAIAHARNPTWWLAMVVGAFAGLAFLTKDWPGLLVLGVWAVALPRSATTLVHLSIGICTCAVMALPWTLYVHLRFPVEAAWESTYNTVRHFTEPLEAHSGGPAFHLVHLPRFFGALSPVAVLAFAAFRGRTREGRTVLAWFVVPYIIFSLARTKMPAYPLVAAPAVALMIAWAVIQLVDAIPQSVGWRRTAAAALVAAWLGLPLWFTIGRWEPFKRFDVEREQARTMKLLSAPPNAVLFGVTDPISAMFYVGVPAYSGLPDPAQVSQCEEAGYRVMLIEPDSHTTVRN